MARYPKERQTFFPERAKTFRCPPDLPEAAADFWRQTAPTLLKHGVLSPIDKPAFKSLCMSYALQKAAAEELLRTGGTFVDDSGNMKRSPAMMVFKAQTDIFIRLSGLFGLSPAARKKVTCQPTAEENDDFDAILGGKYDYA